MRRSTFLFTVALVAACAHPGVSPRTGSQAFSDRLAYQPAAPADRELLPDEQVQHVLNRLAFGARPGDAAAVRAMGVDRWIQRQLHPQAIPNATTERLVARYATLTVPADQLVETYQAVQQAQNQQKRQQAAAGDTGAARRDLRQAMLQSDPKLAQQQQTNQQVLPELQAATLTRAVTSERQLEEVMVNFWENHFSVFAQKGPQERLFLTEYDRDVIRPHAFGKFRDLLGAVAHSPAMLFYLDNWQSQADSVHPTLADLRGPARPGAAAARGRGAALPPISALPPEVQRQLALASPTERQRILQQLQQRMNAQAPQRQRRGLNENYARELMELHTLGVDGGYTQKDVIEVARALSGWTIAMQQGGGFVFRPEMHDAAQKTVLGHTLPSGRGIEDGEQVLDIVASHPATAKFITTKLARHFISDAPPQAVIDRCAAVFTATDGDIRQTVGCVVTSPEFFSRAAYRAKVKTPFQVVASGLRAVQAQPDQTPRSAQAVAQLGQQIFGHQTPDGWPDQADAWMNTGAILGRINFGLMLAAGRVPGVTPGRVPELEQLASSPREAQVDGVIKVLFGGQVSPETRQVLVSGENPLLSTLAPDSTMAMNDMGMGAPPVRRPLAGQNGGGRGQARPGNQQPVALQGLAQVIGLALGAPEFQRR